MRVLSILICLVVLAVPAFAQDQNIAGRWYGQEVVMTHNPSQYDFYIAQLYNDGALDVNFYECRGGQARVSNSQGTWQFADGLFTVIFEKNDGVVSDTPFLSQYNMIEVTKDTMAYIGMRRNRTYQAHRVTDDYKPECHELVM